MRDVRGGSDVFPEDSLQIISLVTRRRVFLRMAMASIGYREVKSTI